MPEKSSGSPEYSVPALEKALDILELLASRREGMTQNQIAAIVGRSASQIFRTLSVLEQRGYILKERPAGLYYLSTRMFRMANEHPPTRGLVQVAMPVMRRLAEAARQGCNLGVWDHGRMTIIAEAESPTPFGFRARVGGTFTMLGAASGRVLLAFQDENTLAGWLPMSDAAGMSADQRNTLLARLPAIRKSGFETMVDGTHAGVTDIAFAIRDTHGVGIAALTIPYIATSYSEVPIAEVTELGLSAAAEISGGLGAIDR